MEKSKDMESSKEEQEEHQPTEAMKSEEVAYKASKEAMEAEQDEEEIMTELEEAEFCLQCAYKPCICMITKLELRIKMLEGIRTIKTVNRYVIQGVFYSLTHSIGYTIVSFCLFSTPFASNIGIEVYE